MMNRQEVLNLMKEAGFSTDWMGFEDVQETVSKYERFATLVERKALAEDGTKNSGNNTYQPFSA